MARKLFVFASTIAAVALTSPHASLAGEPAPDCKSADCAQTQTGPDYEIIVSATRRPRLADQIGSSVSVLSAEEIAARQYSFAADALRDLVSVSIARNSSLGGVASARIRGASSGQTLVVIDNVVMNDPAAPQGGFNFANLDVADIERIEVLRGPQGLVYGADAIGGVISISTARANGASAYLEGGSFGFIRGGAAISGGDETFGRLTVSGVRTDGFSRAAAGTEKDGYRSIAASAAAGASMNEVWSADIRARASDSHAEIDGFPPPDFSLNDTDETENAREYSVAARLAHKTEGLNGALTLAFNSIDRHNEDGGAEMFAADGKRWSLDYLASAHLGARLTATFGGELERVSADASGVDENADNAAIFGLLEWAPAPSLNLSFGARRDEYSAFSGETTLRASGVWKISRSTLLRGSWGEGFRAPTLFELHFDQFGVLPNPDLRPERARGFDIGVEQAIGNADIRVTFFHQKVVDQIDFDFAGFGYFNIDRTRSRGIEAEIDWPVSDWLSMTANYALIDAEDRQSGMQLLRQPKHSSAFIVTWAPVARLALSGSVLFNGDENDFPSANDSFVRADLRAAYKFSDKVEIYGRVENKTDTDYQDVSGYREPGRSAYAGVRVRL